VQQGTLHVVVGRFGGVQLGFASLGHVAQPFQHVGPGAGQEGVALQLRLGSQLDSVPGQGSTVRLELPLQDALKLAA
jgi:hypothetical protein